MMSIVDDFHIHYYNSKVWRQTNWMGVKVLKCPLDLWIYQNILYEKRPNLIIETGTCYGGSALFLAHMMDLMDIDGKIISIDITPRGKPKHPKIDYVTDSSTKSHIIKRIHNAATNYNNVMLILDSDHRKEHVLKELNAYAPIVSKGQYIIVEDTNVNGNPIKLGYGPGPKEAVDEFLSKNNNFSIDSSREKFYLTFSPGGFLLKDK